MDARTLFALLLISCACITAVSTYTVMTIKQQQKIDYLHNYYQSEMENLDSYASYLENESQELHFTIEAMSSEIVNISNHLEKTNESLQENLSELQLLRMGTKYKQHDPTYAEVTNFILSDTTDSRPYEEGTFDCENFAQTINDNAENSGIRCAYVVIYFANTTVGHALVGFYTHDRGMVYVECQTDEWVENLEIGKEYWTECVIPNDHYEYQDAPNDTIQEILLFW
jgi:hypothetical protein